MGLKNTEEETASSLLQAVSFISLAAVIAQGWDTALYLGDEIEYLWKGKFTFVKGIYFVVRYVLLAAQIVHQFLSFRFEEMLLKPLRICRAIFVFRGVFSELALILLEMILFIRVFALYNQSFKVKRLLVTTFIVASFLESIGCFYILRSFMHATSCTCPQSDKTGLLFFSTGAGISQLVVLAMTVAKFLTREQGWGRTPMISLMLKEGVTTFILVIVSMIAVTSIEFLRDVNVGTERATWAWFITALSVLSSRLVMNMRKLTMKHRARYVQEDVTLSELEFYGTRTSICLTTVGDFEY